MNRHQIPQKKNASFILPIANFHVSIQRVCTVSSYQQRYEVNDVKLNISSASCLQLQPCELCNVVAIQEGIHQPPALIAT